MPRHNSNQILPNIDAELQTNWRGGINKAKKALFQIRLNSLLNDIQIAELLRAETPKLKRKKPRKPYLGKKRRRRLDNMATYVTPPDSLEGGSRHESEHSEHSLYPPGTEQVNMPPPDYVQSIQSNVLPEFQQHTGDGFEHSETGAQWTATNTIPTFDLPQTIATYQQPPPLYQQQQGNSPLGSSSTAVVEPYRYQSVATVGMPSMNYGPSTATGITTGLATMTLTERSDVRAQSGPVYQTHPVTSTTYTQAGLVTPQHSAPNVNYDMTDSYHAYTGARTIARRERMRAAAETPYQIPHRGAASGQYPYPSEDTGRLTTQYEEDHIGSVDWEREVTPMTSTAPISTYSDLNQGRNTSPSVLQQPMAQLHLSGGNMVQTTSHSSPATANMAVWSETPLGEGQGTQLAPRHSDPRNGMNQTAQRQDSERSWDHYWQRLSEIDNEIGRITTQQQNIIRVAHTIPPGGLRFDPDDAFNHLEERRIQLVNHRERAYDQMINAPASATTPMAQRGQNQSERLPSFSSLRSHFSTVHGGTDTGPPPLPDVPPPALGTRIGRCNHGFYRPEASDPRRYRDTEVGTALGGSARHNPIPAVSPAQDQTSSNPGHQGQCDPGVRTSWHSTPVTYYSEAPVQTTPAVWMTPVMDPYTTGGIRPLQPGPTVTQQVHTRTQSTQSYQLPEWEVEPGNPAMEMAWERELRGETVPMPNQEAERRAQAKAYQRWLYQRSDQATREELEKEEIIHRRKKDNARYMRSTGLFPHRRTYDEERIYLKETLDNIRADWGTVITERERTLQPNPNTSSSGPAPGPSTSSALPPEHLRSDSLEGHNGSDLLTPDTSGSRRNLSSESSARRRSNQNQQASYEDDQADEYTGWQNTPLRSQASSACYNSPLSRHSSGHQTGSNPRDSNPAKSRRSQESNRRRSTRYSQSYSPLRDYGYHSRGSTPSSSPTRQARPVHLEEFVGMQENIQQRFNRMEGVLPSGSRHTPWYEDLSQETDSIRVIPGDDPYAQGTPHPRRRTSSRHKHSVSRDNGQGHTRRSDSAGRSTSGSSQTPNRSSSYEDPSRESSYYTSQSQSDSFEQSPSYESSWDHGVLLDDLYTQNVVLQNEIEQLQTQMNQQQYPTSTPQLRPQVHFSDSISTIRPGPPRERILVSATPPRARSTSSRESTPGSGCGTSANESRDRSGGRRSSMRSPRGSRTPSGDPGDDSRGHRRQSFSPRRGGRRGSRTPPTDPEEDPSSEDNETSSSNSDYDLHERSMHNWSQSFGRSRGDDQGSVGRINLFLKFTHNEPKFTGDRGNGLEFLREFQHTVQSAALTPSETFRVFRLRLQQTAVTWFDQCYPGHLNPRHSAADVSELYRRFIRRFEGTSLRAAALAKIASRKHQTDESYAAYLFDILQYCEQADPLMDDETVCHHLERGLNAKDIVRLNSGVDKLTRRKVVQQLTRWDAGQRKAITIHPGHKQAKATSPQSGVTTVGKPAAKTDTGPPKTQTYTRPFWPNARATTPKPQPAQASTTATDDLLRTLTQMIRRPKTPDPQLPEPKPNPQRSNVNQRPRYTRAPVQANLVHLTETSDNEEMYEEERDEQQENGEYEEEDQEEIPDSIDINPLVLALYKDWEDRAGRPSVQSAKPLPQRQPAPTNPPSKENQATRPPNGGTSQQRDRRPDNRPNNRPPQNEKSTPGPSRPTTPRPSMEEFQKKTENQIKELAELITKAIGKGKENIPPAVTPLVDPNKPRAPSHTNCFNCGRPGHYQRECPEPWTPRLRGPRPPVSQAPSAQNPADNAQPKN
jgi:Zinc knuckle